MEKFTSWLTDVAVRLVAPKLVAALLLGLATALVGVGLLAPDVAVCLADRQSGLNSFSPALPPARS